MGSARMTSGTKCGYRVVWVAAGVSVTTGTYESHSHAQASQWSTRPVYEKVAELTAFTFAFGLQKGMATTFDAL